MNTYKSRNEPAQELTRKTIVIVAAITLFGFALRLYHLDARQLYGDEYSSLLEAQQLGRNLQSILYFGILHFWLLLGASDFWVRFPSAVFGTLVVPVAYRFGSRAVDRNTGLTLAALLAASSFAIEYSQEVRHYSLFLLTSTISLATFVGLWHATSSRMRRVAWLGASVLVSLSHLFGAFLPLLELLARWLESAPGYKWLARLAFVLLVLTALIMSAPLVMNSTVFSGMERLIGGDSSLRAVEPRGLGLANIAKIPLTLYFFALGQSAYPLAPFSMLGGMLFGIATVVGLIRLRDKPRLLILIISGMLSLALAFLVFDPAAPSFSETASPRHVTMALPIYALLIAIGLTNFRFRKLAYIIAGLVVVYCVAQYYRGDYRYSVPITVSWKDLADRVRGDGANQIAILHDGRSSSSISRYFDSSLRKESYWPYLESYDLGDLKDEQDIVFITNDFKPDRREGFDEVIALLEQDFVMKSGLVSYPLFEYEFHRKPVGQAPGYTVDPSTGEVTIPKEFYGSEFQDLALPAQATIGNASHLVVGAFSLPNLHGGTVRVIPLLGAPEATGLTILSNVTGGNRLRSGETIGGIVVRVNGGEDWVFPLRLGDTTQDWSKDCVGSCQVALTWHKRLALVGQRAYEGSWSDFEARIFGNKLLFEKPAVVESVTIHYTAPSGELHVWGLTLE